MDKLVDAYYKKILILLAVAGGSWVYMIEFFENSNLLYVICGIIFLFVGLIIVVNYVKMNKIIKRMEDEYNR